MAAKKQEFEKRIFSPHGTYNWETKGEKRLKKFEEMVSLAKDAGITHINISGLAERTDYRDEDKYSPWCEWSIPLPAFFKHVLPPGLEDAYPADFVGRQMNFMKKKHDIVVKYGLKSAYFANEPHWLSERIYEKHPEWRGARCDNSLRTIGMFFAPCVDHPEVLDLYRQAAKEIVTQCPSVDTFLSTPNDSGSGYCWSRILYVNPNGASDCRFRDMGDRVMGFFRAIKQGATDAGCKDPDIRLVSFYFPNDEMRNIEAKVRPDEKLGTMGLGCWGGGREVVGYSNPVGMVSGFFNMRNADKEKRDLYFSDDDPRCLIALKLFNETSGTGTEKERLDFLYALARELYGDEVAEDVVAAWQTISKAEMIFYGSGLGLREYIVCGTVGMRWLVRPLVAHPERLMEEEKSYWLPYIYQSEGSQPDTFMDYSNTCGSDRIKTWDMATAISICIDSVSDTLAEAAGLFKKAQEKAKNKDIKEKLYIESLRTRARRCCTLTIRHYAQVSGLINERKKIERELSVDPESPAPETGSEGLFFMYRAMRWELDNTNEIIKIIKESPVPIIRTTSDKAQEGAFIFGPNVLENLEKKVKIMLRHWRETEDGYYRPTLGG